MRRHVRYRPLGKPRHVNVQLGMDEDSRDAEIIDESTGGMGLRVSSTAGIALGQEVEVERRTGTVVGTVVRLERDGMNFHVGLEFNK